MTARETKDHDEGENFDLYPPAGYRYIYRKRERERKKLTNNSNPTLRAV